MIRLARNINETTGLCAEVYLGNDKTKQGFEERDVKASYDGSYYLTEKCPDKPESVIKKEKILALKDNLINTDYQSNKAFEGYPSDDWEAIKSEREAWRLEIRELEGK